MKFESSIRRTLLVRCGIGLSLIFILLSLSIYFVVRRSLYVELDHSIIETASILANQMEYEHGEIIFEWQEGLGTNPEITDQALFQYWNEKSGLTTRSPALGNGNLPKFSSSEGELKLKTISIPGSLENARALGMTIYPYAIPAELSLMSSEGKTFDPLDYPHTLVVARDLTPILHTLTYLAATLGIATFTALALAFLVIRSAVRASLAPISTLTRQVRDRSENQLDAAIILPGALPSELVPLAESFDSLLSRVAAIRLREKDFIRHASHELRTPIAGLAATTELALSKDRSADEYKRHLQTCAKTSADLAALVQRLLALSRIGTTKESAQLVLVNLAETLTACLSHFSGKANALDLKITTAGSSRPVHADPVLTTLILNNLLDNAISYSPTSSSLKILIEEKRDHAELSFTNTCDDLPEDLERLFEPLFRRDPSRTETTDAHLGIGLTLSREAAQSMHGTLTATRPARNSVCFTLSLNYSS